MIKTKYRPSNQNKGAQVLIIQHVYKNKTSDMNDILFGVQAGTNIWTLFSMMNTIWGMTGQNM